MKLNKTLSFGAKIKYNKHGKNDFDKLTLDQQKKFVDAAIKFEEYTDKFDADIVLNEVDERRSMEYGAEEVLGFRIENIKATTKKNTEIKMPSYYMKVTDMLKSSNSMFRSMKRVFKDVHKKINKDIKSKKEAHDLAIKEAKTKIEIAEFVNKRTYDSL